MRKIIKHWFTSADNETFSMSKALSSVAGVAIIYNFVATNSVDFQGFGIARSAIITGLAIKSATDK